MNEDIIEVVCEPGKVGLIAVHGPIKIVVSFSPDQAEKIAVLLQTVAQEARKKPS